MRRWTYREGAWYHYQSNEPHTAKEMAEEYENELFRLLKVAATENRAHIQYVFLNNENFLLTELQDKLRMVLNGVRDYETESRHCCVNTKWSIFSLVKAIIES
jgi:hypothetical protein